MTVVADDNDFVTALGCVLGDIFLVVALVVFVLFNPIPVSNGPLVHELLKVEVLVVLVLVIRLKFVLGRTLWKMLLYLFGSADTKLRVIPKVVISLELLVGFFRQDRYRMS